MRTLFCLLFTLIGISAAQEMSFRSGPSCLMTSGSPTFAQSLATPSLSIDTPLPPIASLPEVGPAVVDQRYVVNPELEQAPNLFPIYYGYSMPSVVEFVSTEPPRELPASFVDAGVVGITGVQSLRQQGYGAPLGDTANFWKEHKPRAPRVYTNADVERLRGN
jgi:hypothetical protein